VTTGGERVTRASGAAKKLINKPADVVREALEGVARATTGAALVEGTTVLVRTAAGPVELPRRAGARAPGRRGGGGHGVVGGARVLIP
jgi:dihydroxyacetone kinase